MAAYIIYVGIVFIAPVSYFFVGMLYLHDWRGFVLFFLFDAEMVFVMNLVSSELKTVVIKCSLRLAGGWGDCCMGDSLDLIS